MPFFAILNIFGFMDTMFVKQELDSLCIVDLKFKLLIIIFELYGIKSIVQNFIYTFFLFIEMKKTCLKTEIFLGVICVKCICIFFSFFFGTQFLKP